MTLTHEPITAAHIAPIPTEVHWTLATLGTTAAAFVAYGTPAPQGSKAYKGQRTTKAGKSVAILAESSKKVKPWRAAVAAVAAQATTDPAWKVLRGPLVVDFVFTLPRPKTFPSGDPRRIHGSPTVYPDVSKLARSTEDAMTGVVWADDAQVIAYRRLEKVYVGSDDPDALRAPGAVIRVWRATMLDWSQRGLL